MGIKTKAQIKFTLRMSGVKIHNMRNQNQSPNGLPHPISKVVGDHLVPQQLPMQFRNKKRLKLHLFPTPKPREMYLKMPTMEIPITISGILRREIPTGITGIIGTTTPKEKVNLKVRVKEKEMAKEKAKVKVVLLQGNA